MTGSPEAPLWCGQTPEKRAKAAVEAFIVAHPEMHPLPETTMQIVRLANDPSCDVGRLERVVSQDAALSAQILRIVNSAFHACANRISRLDQALALLGIRGVKEASLAHGLQTCFKSATLGKYHTHDLWRHCVAVGVAARELGARTNHPQFEEAFLAGLLHDIGFLQLAQVRPDRTSENFLAAEQEDRSFLEIEHEAFGFDHTQLGERLAEQWQLPSSISAACRYHHDPEMAPFDQSWISHLIYVADGLARDNKIGCTLTCCRQYTSTANLTTLGIDNNALQLLSQKLPLLVRLCTV